MKDYRDIAAKLFKDNDVSLNEFQVKYGFKAGHLSRVFRKEGNSHLTIQELIAICKEFGVTSDSILFGDRNELNEVKALKDQIKEFEIKLKSVDEFMNELNQISTKSWEFKLKK